MRRLFPDPGPTSADEQVGRLDLNGLAGGERPYVVSNFALTVDGQATIAGRSGAIGSGADTACSSTSCARAQTRSSVGAGTIRAERYGPMIEDSAARSRRDRDSLAHYPLAVIVSERFDLPWDIPLFTTGLGSVLIATASDAERPETATTVRVVRHPRRSTSPACSAELRHERGVRSVLCEGGPHLHAELFALDLLDELFLTRASKLARRLGSGTVRGRARAPDRARGAFGCSSRSGELFGRYRVRRDESG